jgi:cellulose synthase operon protein C
MSPMTVRWKPLIVLSGLFLVVAVMSLLAFAFALPGKAEDVLPKARADAKANRFENAEIHYRRALQLDAKNVAIHEELADMLARWAAEAPPKDPAERSRLHQKFVRSLTDAAKYGKNRPGPRRRLLADALSRDDPNDALPWADEVIALDATDPDACYVKAIEALDRQPPDLAAAKERLAILERAEATKVRTLWVRARLALASKDDAALETALAAIRSTDPAETLTPSQRLARLRLRLVDVERSDDPKVLTEGVRRFAAEARLLAAEPSPAPGRIRLLGTCLEGMQRHLAASAARNPSAKKELTALGDSLESVAETIYARALDATGGTDLRAHLAYAEHLIFRDQPDKGREVAAKALTLPIASMTAWEATAAGLRETAVKAALGKADDPERFAKAEPFIKDLCASTNPRFAGMGHFFRGLVALERSGLTAAAEGDAKPVVVDPKLRDEALSELKSAAAGLPDASTAQALYGVALILTGEQGLGRQYLQAAYRLGEARDGQLEPRYQVWAAWAILQAGYPEEAEPILAKLQAAVDKGELPADLSPTLHLLRGEAFQARGTDEALKMARAEFLKSSADGRPMSSALQLRLAQIELRVGERQSGLDRLKKLKDDPKAGPSAARLDVLAMRDAGKNDPAKLAEAQKALAAARAKFPDSDELAELESVILADSGDPAGAEKVLAAFVAKHPDRVALAMARAHLLAVFLNRPDEARAVLAELSDKAETSAPLVQLALLDISRKDLTAAAKTIARIRSRWKEAAAADLLDARLALASEDPRAAAVHLESALAKDPNNKVAVLWKAVLDERNGAKRKASQALQGIIRDKPVKEIEDGLSLTRAAEWALADMALQNQDHDAAIKGFEGLVQANPGGDLDRAARWKLVAARAGRGDGVKAKAEVAELLTSPKTTADERVQAADFYRRQGDDAACRAQLDIVLKADPTNTGAVAYKALALASKGKPDEAAALIRKTLAVAKAPPSNLYLMLAAAENLAEPKDQAPARALKALDDGLARDPKSVELIQAKYQVMKILKAPNAVAWVEAAVKADPSRPMRGVLAEVYREERDFVRAESVVRDIMKDAPKDARLAALLVGLVSGRATMAQEAGDRDAAKKADAEAADLIRRFRTMFPTDSNFVQAEWDLAFRRGEFAKARTLCDELAKSDPGSPAGPLLRARLHAIENKTEEVARDYDEALARSPGRTDIRLALAQADLALGKIDDALKQTKMVLDAEHDQPTALLLKAQALVQQDGTPAQKAANRDQAADSIRDAIRVNPSFLEAYHLLAELRMLQGDRPKALQALRKGLAINHNDDTGLSSLIFHLCETRDPAAPPSAADLAEAKTQADDFAKRDDRGVFALAVAVGYQRAGKIDLALPWADKAAKKIDRPGVHMAYGGILLAKAEAMPSSADSIDVFTKAIEQYDAVLKAEPNAVEAVNNKAWILHHHLKRDSQALAVAEGLAKTAPNGSLPAEFYDTLGSIQEAMKQVVKAEASYDAGLRRMPEHATLNYHMGKLLLADPKRAAKAAGCLEKARANRAKLSPEMAKDLDELIKTVSR